MLKLTLAFVVLASITAPAVASDYADLLWRLDEQQRQIDRMESEQQARELRDQLKASDERLRDSVNELLHRPHHSLSGEPDSLILGN